MPGNRGAREAEALRLCISGSPAEEEREAALQILRGFTDTQLNGLISIKLRLRAASEAKQDRRNRPRVRRRP